MKHIKSLAEFETEINLLRAGKPSEIDQAVFAIAGITAQQIFEADRDYMTNPANERAWHAIYFAVYTMVISTTQAIEIITEEIHAKSKQSILPQQSKRWNGNN